jgi:hypothetical protein
MSGELITPGGRWVTIADGTKSQRVGLDSNTFEMYHPLMIERSLGAGDGDRCTFEIVRPEILSDRQLAGAADTRDGSFRVLVRDGGEQLRTVFWGQFAGVTHGIDEERTTAEWRISRFHFGKPLEGVLQLLPPTGGRSPPTKATQGFANDRNLTTKERAELERQRSVQETPPEAAQDARVVLVHKPLVFNPLIDGVVRGNMYDTESPKFLGFIDWESVRTAAARRYQRYKYSSDEAFKNSENERQWTLGKACEYLCKALNGKESRIRNPDAVDFQEIDAVSYRPRLRNVGLESGLYLNECLDRLLSPLGWSFFVGFNHSGQPQIRFCRRGEGKRVTIKLQKPGESFEPKANNLIGGSVSAGSHSSFNEVVIFGSAKRYEVSIELIPGWKEDYDSLTDEETRTDSDQYKQRPEYRDVHRKFVANEGADYVGTRAAAKKPFDLKEIFGHEVVTRRRRALSCISRMPDGTPVSDNGVLVRWKFIDEDEDAAWRPLDEMDFGQVELLEQEIGIRFTGQWAPLEVVNKIRGGVTFQLTCSIEDDERVRGGKLTADTASPLPGVIRQVRDERDRFHFRKVHPTSSLYDQVKAGELQADEVDDTEAATLHGISLANSFDTLDVNGELSLIGWNDPEIELGDVVHVIDGRNLELSADPYRNGTSRFAQVVSIAYDLIGYTRKIGLQTLRNQAP